MDESAFKSLTKKNLRLEYLGHEERAKVRNVAEISGIIQSPYIEQLIFSPFSTIPFRKNGLHTDIYHRDKRENK